MQLRGGNHSMQGKIVGSWLGMAALRWRGGGVDDGSHCPATAMLLERVECALTWLSFNAEAIFCLFAFVFLSGMLERRDCEISHIPSVSGI